MGRAVDRHAARVARDAAAVKITNALTLDYQATELTHVHFGEPGVFAVGDLAANTRL